MSVKRDAELFSAGIDGGGTVEEGRFSAELAMARAIRGVDFSRGSPSLPVIEARTAAAAERWAADHASRPRARAAWARRPAIAVAAIVLAVVALQVSVPGGLPAAAAAAREAMLTFLRVGRHTIMTKFDPNAPGQPSDPRMVMWEYPTSIVLVRDEVPRGAPRDGWSFSSVAAAKAAARGMRFLAPSHVPEGYSLGAVALSPSKHWIVATYLNPTHGRIDFVAHDTRGTPGTELNADTDIMKADVNGHPAGWTGRALVWESGAVSYLVGGTSLSEDEAIRMAESLR